VTATRRLLSVCRHEAAHAVAHEVLGNRVRAVRVESARRGFCEYGVRGKPDPLVEGITALAGHAADIYWGKRARTVVPADDHKRVLALGFRGRSLPTLLEMASQSVAAYFEVIDAVARELWRRDLTGADVRRIMRASK
jgi:hypothetical protein